MKALLYPRLSDDVLALARSLLPGGLELEVAGDENDEEGLVRALAGADVMMGFVRRPFGPRVLQAMGHLKLVQLLSAGYDAVDVAAMRRLGVPVATNGGANAVAVAEHAILLMLAVYRDLVNLDRLVRDGGWHTGRLGTRRLYELAGKTVGLVGLGMIGREVARRLRAWEVTLLYSDVARAPAEVEAELGIAYVPLPELLAASDVVSLHVPLLPETSNLIDGARLALMKRSAVLINTCRGGVVDTQALYEALRDGTIAGAGLDTVEPEPPPADHPLLSLPNVVITPHTAGPTVDSWPKRLANAYANVQRVAAGEPPRWVIPELRDLA